MATGAEERYQILTKWLRSYSLRISMRPQVQTRRLLAESRVARLGHPEALLRPPSGPARLRRGASVQLGPDALGIREEVRVTGTERSRMVDENGELGPAVPVNVDLNLLKSIAVSSAQVEQSHLKRACEGRAEATEGQC